MLSIVHDGRHDVEVGMRYLWITVTCVVDVFCAEYFCIVSSVVALCPFCAPLCDSFHTVMIFSYRAPITLIHIR